MLERQSTGGLAPSPIFACLFAVASLVLATSCDKSSKQEQTRSVSGKLDETQCDGLLATALGGLKPERLGVDSDRRATVDSLNQWSMGCGKLDERPPAIDASVLAMIDKVTGPQQLEHFNDSQFSGRDGLHVRNCYLMKRMADKAAAKSKNNLDRVVDILDCVNRNVVLQDSDPKLPPNTLYTAAIFGTGSAEDRAWLFAAILKQLRIDAFILRPRNDAAGADEKTKAKRWLVGVPLDGQIYLFDMRLGTPVPAADDNAEATTVRKPATLESVKQHDELLRALDLPDGRAYPLNASDFKELDVEVVGDTSYWVPRMAQLQSALAGANSVIIYDPLEDQNGNAGALRRAAEAGKGNWDKSAVTLWAYPEQSIEQFESRAGDQANNYQIKMLPFQSPFRFQQTEKGLLPVPMVEHQKGRILQLVGDFDGAIINYNNSLIEQDQRHIPGVPPAYQIAHIVAADNATIWTAMSHLEEGDPAAALNTLRKYKRRHQNSNESAPWMDHCRAMIAQIHASRGEFDDALKELAAIPATNAEKDRFDLLAMRWKKSATATTDAAKAGDAANATNSGSPAQTDAPNAANSPPAGDAPSVAPKPAVTP